MKERFSQSVVDKSVLDDEISNLIYERNRKMIVDQVSQMSDVHCNFSRVKMWKLRQKVCPKIQPSCPVAKINQNGDIVSNRDELKQLYVDTYRDRLRHRVIKPNYDQIKQLKDYLFQVRLNTAKLRKSNAWSESELLQVTSKLKCNKAADPMGLVFEIFRPEVAGSDLFQSLLQLCNKVKDECDIPNFLELTNISSIFKNRGSKMDLNNDRGVFNVMTVRSIIDNLVYNDYYDEIDSSMSDTNVGGRKNRNIRDNLFIVYGIINYALEEKKQVDLTLYDIAKCFDSMWFQETMNDLWDCGVQDDRFALISKLNTNCDIAVKTPVGITDRFQMKEIEMQGTKLSNIKCAVQIDTLGKECYIYNEGMFLYKECVSVPPLGMIDDVASFSECGIESLKINAIINAKIEAKKLEFGAAKCVNIPIGHRDMECLEQRVHSETVSEKSYETYLGDIVCSSGSNDRNIESRCNRGIGAVSQIMTMLGRVSLGHYYFDIGLVLRDTILVSKLVFNSEVWYNVTEKQLTKMEKIDEMLFRKIFNLPSTAPRVGMFIECGKIPIRHVVKSRRIMYFWHLMHKEKDELLVKFLEAQELSPSSHDWICQVRKDMQDIKLNLSDAEIENLSKDVFSKLVKRKIEVFTLQYLKGHSGSKTSQLDFKNISPAEYLFAPQLNLEQVQTLYKLRNRVIDVKGNSRSFNTQNMWCRTCFLFPEGQSHLLVCPAIVAKLKNVVDFKTLDHKMVFGTLDNQIQIAKIYTVILKTRLDLIDEMRRTD